MAMNRRHILATIASRRDATVITLIHRQETISLLGIPLAWYVDIDDAESVLRAIRETPTKKTIEIIRTPLAASLIALAGASLQRPLICVRPPAVDHDARHADHHHHAQRDQHQDLPALALALLPARAHVMALNFIGPNWLSREVTIRIAPSV